MHPVIRISLISALNWSIMSSLQRGSETISESGDFVPFSRQSFKKFKVQSWEIGTCYSHSIKSWFLTTAGMHHFVNADLNINQYTFSFCLEHSALNVHICFIPTTWRKSPFRNCELASFRVLNRDFFPLSLSVRSPQFTFPPEGARIPTFSLFHSRILMFYMLRSIELRYKRLSLSHLWKLYHQQLCVGLIKEKTMGWESLNECERFLFWSNGLNCD